MGHYNRIARDLAERPEDYAPVLGVDPNSGETLWEPWIGGFERAMRLRPVSGGSRVRLYGALLEWSVAVG